MLMDNIDGTAGDFAHGIILISCSGGQLECTSGVAELSLIGLPEAPEWLCSLPCRGLKPCFVLNRFLEGPHARYCLCQGRAGQWSNTSFRQKTRTLRGVPFSDCFFHGTGFPLGGKTFHLCDRGCRDSRSGGAGRAYEQPPDCSSSCHDHSRRSFQASRLPTRRCAGNGGRASSLCTWHCA